nr:hypothetical protein [Rhizobium ruizarguesonis]
MISRAAKFSIAVASLLASSSLATAAPAVVNCKAAVRGTLEYRLCMPTRAIQSDSKFSPNDNDRGSQNIGGGKKTSSTGSLASNGNGGDNGSGNGNGNGNGNGDGSGSGSGNGDGSGSGDSSGNGDGSGDNGGKDDQRRGP